MSNTINVAVLGASGYTGADAIRLGLAHPNVRFVALTANSHAGKPIAEVYPHLAHAGLPDLTTVEETDWSGVDAVIAGLPHATAQKITRDLVDSHPDVKFVDMSADFRFRDPAVYSATYGIAHEAESLQKDAVYGLTEHYRDAIRDARLVACPGCYPTAALTALLPAVSAKAIDATDIIIDAKSGVSGAGRGLKLNTLFTEAGEGLSPYGVASHRHAPEIEQELSAAAGHPLLVNFTPHLVPMNRGELCTCHLRLADGVSADDLRQILAERYSDEPFIHVVDKGVTPKTQNVRGSNHVEIGVFADRIPGRAIVIVVLDNLVKGSAGQALQNLNLMFGLDETTGLKQLPLFP